MLKTRIDVRERSVEVAFARELSAAARSQNFARVAREELEKGQEQNRQVLGRVPPHETFVDGNRTERLESVKPDGLIVFEFELLEDVFQWIGEQLIKHSPVRSGRFRESFVFMAGDQVVEPGAPLPPAEEYVFVNIQPYARKIERGLSPQAPDGVMHVIATMAQRRFGNMAKVSFGYRTPLFGAINAWANRTNMASPGRRGRQRAEWLRRQPAVVVVPR